MNMEMSFQSHRNWSQVMTLAQNFHFVGSQGDISSEKRETADPWVMTRVF